MLEPKFQQLRMLTVPTRRGLPLLTKRVTPFRTAGFRPLVLVLLLVSGFSNGPTETQSSPLSPSAPSAPSQSLPSPFSPLSQSSPASHLERAEQYRQAGDLRREQFELTKAIRSWPNSSELRYAYALHLVRRRNLSEALAQTTQSLGQNLNQPTTANLHLLLLDGLKRPAVSATWVSQLLLLNRAKPPLEPWSSGWLARWQQVLQLGRLHAAKSGDTSAQTLIENALSWTRSADTTPSRPQTNTEQR